ncbi:MAG: hypothetical protein ABI885_16410 [Gammaproteobacteria bacterium]
MPGVEFHFCAPIFATRKQMDVHYLAQTVEINSLWIDAKNAGQIVDEDLHSIIYSEDGTRSFLFSEKARPLKVLQYERRRTERAQRHSTTLEEVAPHIYARALAILHDY